MPQNSKKILIVEDEKPIARAIDLKLTHAGFATKTAFDGEEALRLLTDEKFDLVLLDLVLPKRNGFSVLEELKERNDKTPVIVVSNLSQEGEIQRAKALGAREYFIKSDVPISEIVAHVKQMLNQKA